MCRERLCVAAYLCLVLLRVRKTQLIEVNARCNREQEMERQRNQGAGAIHYTSSLPAREEISEIDRGSFVRRAGMSRRGMGTWKQTQR